MTAAEAKKFYKNLTLEHHEKAKKHAKAMLKLFGRTGKHWTVGSMARNTKGAHVEATSKTAVKWCLVGAMIKLKIRDDRGWLALSLANTIGCEDVIGFNDRDGFPPVKEVLTKIAEQGVLSKDVKLMKV